MVRVRMDEIAENPQARRGAGIPGNDTLSFMAHSNLEQPLSDDEIEDLGNFLLEANDGEAMTVDELDGFFVALICGPELVPPSEYMPVIWRAGELSSIFETPEEANRYLSLMMRLWNTIAHTLSEGEPYKPLIFDEALDGVPSVTRWAIGFKQGMALRAESWEPLIQDKEASILLMPVLEFSDRDEPVAGVVPLEALEPMDEMLLFSLMASIPAIYAYMRGRLGTGRAAKKTSAKKKSPRKPARQAPRKPRKRPTV